MAASITTDADLMATGYILADDKDRLTPPEWRDKVDAAGPWVLWHEEAWSETLRHLDNRTPPVEEADLTTPSELAPVVLRYVLYLAFMASGEYDAADRHRAEYGRMMRSIRPTVNGAEDLPVATWGGGVTMVRGS